MMAKEPSKLVEIASGKLLNWPLDVEVITVPSKNKSTLSYFFLKKITVHINVGQ